MAREFVMGAKLRLADSFSDVVRKAVRHTNQLRSSLAYADKSTLTWRDSSGRLRNELGRFAAKAQKTTVVTDRQAKAVRNLKSSYDSLRNVIQAVVGGYVVKKGYDWLVGANADMETYEQTLTVVLGSQEKALQQLEWANKFAKETPFEIPEIVEATTRMAAYGMNAQKTLGIIGDMASVMGKDLMQAVEAIADAQTGELERLKEFGITKRMIEEQAKLLGTAAFDTKGSLKDQTALNAALFAIMEKRYAGGMELQSKTFKGMISNLQDTIGTMGRELGKPLFDKAKANLQTFLDTLERLEENGAIDRFTRELQQVTGVVFSVFGQVGRFVTNTAVVIADKFTAFYNKHRPQIIRIGAAFVAVFQTLREYATPILTWLVDTGLPGVIDVLTVVAGWVINIADFFVQNWGWIGPIVLGLAGALTTYKMVLIGINTWTKIVTATQAAYNGMMAAGGLAAKAITAAQIAYRSAAVGTSTVMRVLTAVQAGFNAVLLANPIGLVIAAIGILIGVGYLLWKNWDTVKAKATELWKTVKENPILSFLFRPILQLIDAGILLYKNWDKIKAKAVELWNGLKTVWGNITNWVTDKIEEAREWGSNIIKTMLEGILSMKDKLVDGVRDVFGKVREMLPFSDAKKGPFSQLTYSGGAIMTTLAKGVQLQTPALHKQIARSFADAPAISGLASGKIDAAGVTNNTSNTSKNITIQKLVDRIVLENVGDRDTDSLVDELLDKLHEKLAAADEILGADKGVLLNG